MILPYSIDFCIEVLREFVIMKIQQINSCFINCYEPGVRLTAHIDQDEKDFDQPIVSVSLGASAIFQIFGKTRGGKAMNIPLHSGDLLIFGGPARRLYHGVKKLEHSNHPLTTDKRYNLTFRKAL